MSIVEQALEKSRAEQRNGTSRRASDGGAQRSANRTKQAAAIDPTLRIRPPAVALDADLSQLLVQMGGLATAVLLLQQVRTRTRLVKVAAAAGLAFLAMSVATGLLSQQTWSYILADGGRNFAWAATAGFLLSGSLPLVERCFGIITEAIDSESLDLVEEYADVIQIGARNMQNFSLLKRAGRAKKPVLLKRGMSATLDEFLMAAEYIMSEGNYNVMLCERGVRTFSDFSRNTLDLAVVPAVKKRSHLPILVDPSHGTGKRHKVLPLSRAAVAVGADGLLIEVHHEPDKALSDGMQSILPEEFAVLADEMRQIAAVLHRTVN